MTKWILRGVSILVIVVCIVWGSFMVITYSDKEDSDAGVAMVRLLYEYDQIQDVYDRQDQIRSQCSPEVWSELSSANDAHWNGTYERTQNAETKVRIVMTRPGLVIYALENEFVYPAYLWCFEYEVDHGLFTSVREYKLVGMRESKDGGFF